VEKSGKMSLFFPPVYIPQHQLVVTLGGKSGKKCYLYVRKNKKEQINI
jgi:hypothetical protein